MVKRSGISLKSRFGLTVSNMLLTHEDGARNLAILFPGGDNSTDIPLLHYARKAALLCGCDVLSLEYGYKIGYGTLKEPEIIEAVVDECFEVITRTSLDSYGQLFLISKSMGHFISFKIDDMLKEKTIRHICYTPVTANIKDLSKRNCKVFTGSKDKWITKESVESITNLSNIDLRIVENGVHSLEIDDDYITSIKILEDVTKECADYIKKYMIM